MMYNLNQCGTGGYDLTQTVMPPDNKIINASHPDRRISGFTIGWGRGDGAAAHISVVSYIYLCLKVVR